MYSWIVSSLLRDVICAIMESNFFLQKLSVKLMNCYLCDDGV
jgi:hypothetical protein